ncbi:transposase [Gemmiger sp.]
MEYQYPKRKTTKIQEFDYSSVQAYFVTTVAADRKQIFSRIDSGGQVELFPIGQAVQRHIDALPTHYACVYVQKYVIMPNHVHMVIFIGQNDGQKRPSMNQIMAAFKAGVSREIGQPIWQRSYYDHVIRNQQDYDEVWKYIDNNPIQWVIDGKA